MRMKNYTDIQLTGITLNLNYNHVFKQKYNNEKYQLYLYSAKVFIFINSFLSACRK